MHVHLHIARVTQVNPIYQVVLVAVDQQQKDHRMAQHQVQASAQRVAVEMMKWETAYVASNMGYRQYVISNNGTL